MTHADVKVTMSSYKFGKLFRKKDSNPMATTTSAPKATAFAPVRKATAAQGIIEQFKNLMRSKEFVAGSKLPSEQELANELGVSRPTVREAQQTLGLLGILDTRHGSGTRVTESVDGILKVPF